MNKIRIKKLKVTSEMECSKLMSGWGIRSYASSKTTSTLCTCERGLCIRIKRLLNSGRITPADVSNTTKKGRKDGNLENLWRWKTCRARKEKPERGRGSSTFALADAAPFCIGVEVELQNIRRKFRESPPGKGCKVFLLFRRSETAMGAKTFKTTVTWGRFSVSTCRCWHEVSLYVFF